MERTDEQRIVTAVLRCVGIVVVLVGLILTTYILLQWLAARSAAQNLPPGMNVNFEGVLGKLRGWAFAGTLSVCAWGAALYALSRPLARLVVDNL